MDCRGAKEEGERSDEEAIVAIQVREVNSGGLAGLWGQWRWAEIVTLMYILQVESQGLTDGLNIGYEGKGRIKDKI